MAKKKGKKRLVHHKVEEPKVKHHHIEHKQKEEHFYVQVEDHKDLRRDILQSAVEVTQILKSYERLKKFKDEKKQYKDQLRKCMKEVAVLLTHLKRVEMPLYSEVKEEIRKEGLVLKRGWEEVEKRISESEKKAVKEKEAVVKGFERPVFEQPKPISDLDRDLIEIKEKLRNLNV